MSQDATVERKIENATAASCSLRCRMLISEINQSTCFSCNSFRACPGRTARCFPRKLAPMFRKNAKPDAGGRGPAENLPASRIVNEPLVVWRHIYMHIYIYI